MSWWLSPSGWPTTAGSADEEAVLTAAGYVPIDESQVAAAVAAYKAGSPPPAGPDFVTVDELQTPTSPARAALGAAFVAQLPTVGSLTYNGDGTIASDADGSTYTWNTDGTPATQTKGGVTRTFHWNTDGTLASVS